MMTAKLLVSPDCAAPSVLQLVPMFQHDFSRGSRSADNEWGQHPTNILLGAAIIKLGGPQMAPQNPPRSERPGFHGALLSTAHARVPRHSRVAPSKPPSVRSAPAQSGRSSKPRTLGRPGQAVAP